MKSFLVLCLLKKKIQNAREKQTISRATMNIAMELLGTVQPSCAAAVQFITALGTIHSQQLLKFYLEESTLTLVAIFEALLSYPDRRPFFQFIVRVFEKQQGLVLVKILYQSRGEGGGVNVIIASALEELRQITRMQDPPLDTLLILFQTFHHLLSTTNSLKGNHENDANHEAHCAFLDPQDLDDDNQDDQDCCHATGLSIVLELLDKVRHHRCNRSTVFLVLWYGLKIVSHALFSVFSSSTSSQVRRRFSPSHVLFSLRRLGSGSEKKDRHVLLSTLATLILYSPEQEEEEEDLAEEEEEEDLAEEVYCERAQQTWKINMQACKVFAQVVTGFCTHEKEQDLMIHHVGRYFGHCDRTTGSSSSSTTADALIHRWCELLTVEDRNVRLMVISILTDLCLDNPTFVRSINRVVDLQPLQFFQHFRDNIPAVAPRAFPLYLALALSTTSGSRSRYDKCFKKHHRSTGASFYSALSSVTELSQTQDDWWPKRPTHDPVLCISLTLKILEIFHQLTTSVECTPQHLLCPWVMKEIISTLACREIVVAQRAAKLLLCLSSQEFLKTAKSLKCGIAYFTTSNDDFNIVVHRKGRALEAVFETTSIVFPKRKHLMIFTCWLQVLLPRVSAVAAEQPQETGVEKPDILAFTRDLLQIMLQLLKIETELFQLQLVPIFSTLLFPLFRSVSTVESLNSNNMPLQPYSRVQQHLVDIQQFVLLNVFYMSCVGMKELMYFAKYNACAPLIEYIHRHAAADEKSSPVSRPCKIALRILTTVVRNYQVGEIMTKHFLPTFQSMLSIKISSDSLMNHATLDAATTTKVVFASEMYTHLATSLKLSNVTKVMESLFATMPSEEEEGQGEQSQAQYTHLYVHVHQVRLVLPSIDTLVAELCEKQTLDRTSLEQQQRNILHPCVFCLIQSAHWKRKLRCLVESDDRAIGFEVPMDLNQCTIQFELWFNTDGEPDEAAFCNNNRKAPGPRWMTDSFVYDLDHQSNSRLPLMKHLQFFCHKPDSISMPSAARIEISISSSKITTKLCESVLGYSILQAIRSPNTDQVLQSVGNLMLTLCRNKLFYLHFYDVRFQDFIHHILLTCSEQVQSQMLACCSALCKSAMDVDDISTHAGALSTLQKSSTSSFRHPCVLHRLQFLTHWLQSLSEIQDRHIIEPARECQQHSIEFLCRLFDAIAMNPEEVEEQQGDIYAHTARAIQSENMLRCCLESRSVLMYLTNLHSRSHTSFSSVGFPSSSTETVIAKFEEAEDAVVSHHFFQVLNRCCTRSKHLTFHLSSPGNMSWMTKVLLIQPQQSSISVLQLIKSIMTLLLTQTESAKLRRRFLRSGGLELLERIGYRIFYQHQIDEKGSMAQMFAQILLQLIQDPDLSPSIFAREMVSGRWNLFQAAIYPLICQSEMDRRPQDSPSLIGIIAVAKATAPIRLLLSHLVLYFIQLGFHECESCLRDSMSSYLIDDQERPQAVLYQQVMNAILSNTEWTYQSQLNTITMMYYPAMMKGMSLDQLPKLKKTFSSFFKHYFAAVPNEDDYVMMNDHSMPKTLLITEHFESLHQALKDERNHSSIKLAETLYQGKLQASVYQTIHAILYVIFEAYNVMIFPHDRNKSDQFQYCLQLIEKLACLGCQCLPHLDPVYYSSKCSQMYQLVELLCLEIPDTAKEAHYQLEDGIQVLLDLMKNCIQIDQLVGLAKNEQHKIVPVHDVANGLLKQIAHMKQGLTQLLVPIYTRKHRAVFQILSSAIQRIVTQYLPEGLASNLKVIHARKIIGDREDRQAHAYCHDPIRVAPFKDYNMHLNKNDADSLSASSATSGQPLSLFHTTRSNPTARVVEPHAIIRTSTSRQSHFYEILLQSLRRHQTIYFCQIFNRRCMLNQNQDDRKQQSRELELFQLTQRGLGMGLQHTVEKNKDEDKGKGEVRRRHHSVLLHPVMRKFMAVVVFCSFWRWADYRRDLKETLDDDHSKEEHKFLTLYKHYQKAKGELVRIWMPDSGKLGQRFWQSPLYFAIGLGSPVILIYGWLPLLQTHYHIEQVQQLMNWTLLCYIGFWFILVFVSMLQLQQQQSHHHPRPLVVLAYTVERERPELRLGPRFFWNHLMLLAIVVNFVQFNALALRFENKWLVDYFLVLHMNLWQATGLTGLSSHHQSDDDSEAKMICAVVFLVLWILLLKCPNRFQRAFVGTLENHQHHHHDHRWGKLNTLLTLILPTIVSQILYMGLSGLFYSFVACESSPTHSLVTHPQVMCWTTPEHRRLAIVGLWGIGLFMPVAILVGGMTQIVFDHPHHAAYMDLTISPQILMTSQIAKNLMAAIMLFLPHDVELGLWLTLGSQLVLFLLLLLSPRSSSLYFIHIIQLGLYSASIYCTLVTLFSTLVTPHPIKSVYRLHMGQFVIFSVTSALLMFQAVHREISSSSSSSSPDDADVSEVSSNESRQPTVLDQLLKSTTLGQKKQNPLLRLKQRRLAQAQGLDSFELYFLSSVRANLGTTRNSEFYQRALLYDLESIHAKHIHRQTQEARRRKKQFQELQQQKSKTMLKKRISYHHHHNTTTDSAENQSSQESAAAASLRQYLDQAQALTVSPTGDDLLLIRCARRLGKKIHAYQEHHREVQHSVTTQ